ncbi:hypothetical protein [Sessilibacter sp. MAH2]
MKLNKIALGVFSAITAVSVQAQVTSFTGYAAHGVNFYNGSRIGDYSSVSPTIGQLFQTPREVGFLDPNPDAIDAGIITPETDRSTLIATTSGFLDFFNPGGAIDQSLVNQPLGNIGNNFFGFGSVDDRVVLPSFPEGPAEPEPTRREGLVENPTVGQWEQINGLLTVKSKDDGTSVVRITIRDAFPDAVYTFWDAGAYSPLSSEESGYVIPLGGVPNVAVTNSEGCAFKEFEVPYDLVRACETGASSCTSFVAGFYHWDGQLYGASPAATFANAPTGVYAGVQMIWPIAGDLLQEPARQFTKPRVHGCFGPKPFLE